MRQFCSLWQNSAVCPNIAHLMSAWMICCEIGWCAVFSAPEYNVAFWRCGILPSRKLLRSARSGREKCQRAANEPEVQGTYVVVLSSVASFKGTCNTSSMLSVWWQGALSPRLPFQNCRVSPLQEVGSHCKGM